MQHLSRVCLIQESSGFGMALPQGGVADFMVLILAGIRLDLGYPTLDVLKIPQNLSDSQGPSFVD